MASWPTETNIISTRIPRLDGLAKASGKAKYPSDERPEGILFGVVLYSPYAAATVKSIDTSAAEKLPGVKAIFPMVKAGSKLRFHGDDIAAVAAETEEQARDAVRAIKVEYEVLPHAATEAQAMAEGSPSVLGSAPNAQKGRARANGDVEKAIGEADAKVTGTYYAPVITHVCLEPHGLTVQFKDNKITSWASTQSVQGVASQFAERFNIPVADVKVYTEVMGGGFGSKFGPDSWGFAAAELSKMAGGRPVKLFLDRAQEHLAAGMRPSVGGTITVAGKKDGTVTAFVAESYGTGGVSGGASVLLPYVYAVKNTSVGHTELATNTGGSRAMRAPRHPQSSLLTEAAFDDLAEALGVDPLEMRLKNLPDRDPVQGADRTKIYQDEVKLGAEAFGWKEKYKTRAENAKAKGPIKRGVGVALHQWGGGGAPGKQVTCEIHPDGTVITKAGTQDIGTGIRTLIAIIAAEALGLKPTDVNSQVGHSDFPPGQASGGSTTTPSTAPPAWEAALKARAQLFERIAPKYQAEPSDLELKDGQLLVKGQPKDTFKDACRKLGMSPVSVTSDANLRELSSNGVGGCQFAEVEVDVETGVVKVKRVVAVQDSGLILDMLTWESQVYGGVIGGLNYALFEERVIDPTTGRMLNPDMELYKLMGASDLPEIKVIPYDTPEMRARGAIGVGEPPVISTASAVGNAVSNAIGVRVPTWPMTPWNVLEALSKAKGEA